MIFDHQPLESVYHDRILMVGDLHCNTSAALAVINHAVALEADVIIQVGDIGFFPRWSAGDFFLKTVEMALDAAGLKMFFIDGNHEDHESLSMLYDAPDGTRVVSRHIRHITRTHRWDWDGNVWLAMGGGPSLDRNRRAVGWDWFQNEMMTDFIANAAVAAGPADVVVAHDSPWVEGGKLYHRYEQHLPPEGRRASWPVDALVTSDWHQKLMRSVLDGVNPRVWFNGHHHVRFTGIAGGTRIESLGMDAHSLQDLCLLVDSSGSVL